MTRMVTVKFPSMNILLSSGIVASTSVLLSHASRVAYRRHSFHCFIETLEKIYEEHDLDDDGSINLLEFINLVDAVYM